MLRFGLIRRFAASSWLVCAVCSADYVPSPEPGWPQFRGPCRNGISAEKGLLQEWPEGGPTVLWAVTNVGSGYSAPTISKGKLFITGDIGDELHIFAFDLSGELLWKATNGASWKTPYPGARSSCAYAGGHVYHANAHGQIACFEAQGGTLVWTTNAIQIFEGRVPTWGIAECLLVDGDRVIVTPGGKMASMTALDRRTGEVVWKTEPLPSAGSKAEGPSYAPPILINVQGQRHIAGATARHFFGVDANSGKLQWQFEMPTRFEVLGSSPVHVKEGVFVTGPDGGDGRFLKLTRTGETISAEQTWASSLDTCHGGIIPLDGFLYGSFYRDFNGWGCVDATDGRVPWRSKELVMGSAIYADGHLYVLAQNGIMALVRVNPEKMEIVSRFTLAPKHQNNVWAHPVIFDKKLFLRDQTILRCYDIAAR